jgi:RNA polymerase sigma-70 factor (ECF subfamily)
MTNDLLIQDLPRDEDPAGFHTKFWRCRRLLHFIACRILGGPERADDAIENCWLTASRNPPRFEHQSAFRSWLLRVLIDEALAIRRRNEGSLERRASVEPIPSHEIRWEYIRDAQRRTPIENPQPISTYSRNRGMTRAGLRNNLEQEEV